MKMAVDAANEYAVWPEGNEYDDTLSTRGSTPAKSYGLMRHTAGLTSRSTTIIDMATATMMAIPIALCLG